MVFSDWFRSLTKYEKPNLRKSIWQLINTFVPFIALFSKSYREGKEDALVLSKQLTRPYIFPIIFTIAFTMLIQAGLEYAPEVFAELANYFMRSLCLILSDLVNVLSFSLIYLLFEQALENYRPEES